MAVKNRLAAVDEYIARSRPFAQPILTHLRETLHGVIPAAEEQMKWSRPFFVYRGVILGNISAFKEHCAFGLWGEDLADVLRAEGVVAPEKAMGSFGRITSLEDLPPTAELERYIRYAADLIDSGERTRSIQRVAKPARIAPEIPAALLAALEHNSLAKEAFQRFSPSCQREYAQWVAGAKREETKQRRVAAALELIATGKSLNWKYATKP